MNTYWTVYLLFGLIVVGYLLGGTSPMFAAADNPLNNQNSTYCDNTSGSCYTSSGQSFFLTFLTNLGNYIFSTNGIIAVLLSLSAAVAISMLTGQLNLLAVIPIALAFFIVQYILLPTSFILNSGLPIVVQIILQAFFYLLTVMTLVGFMRTGN